MDKQQVLQSFGLTEAEVKLYLMLLNLGEATASELSIKTNTNRTFTYDRIKKLLDTGLISFVIKDNKKYFKAAEPSQLVAILNEKLEQVKTVLPELEKLKQPREQKSEVKIFSSKNGIRSALNLILNKKQQVYIHGSLKNFEKVMEEYYTIWNVRRVKENIKTKILSNEDISLELAEIDLLTAEERSSITTFTFGNNVIIALWSTLPIAIHIESQEIAKDTLNFFNAVWQREIKIYSGVDGIIKAYFELIQGSPTYYIGIGYSEALAKVYGTRMSDDWHKIRLKKDLTARLISYPDKNSKNYFRKRMKQWQKFHVRFLPKDICGPACITLSDHMIATFIYTEKDFKVIVNKNKETIAAYKKHFEELWKKAER
ncbi:hypothetical protein HZA96_03835 [Candidatus Woesearchaeota archaeon]|nr:hypothetical protein [Candidatus Woesearchaeota archaeon]